MIGGQRHGFGKDGIRKNYYAPKSISCGIYEVKAKELIVIIKPSRSQV
jgi:hypothetical protein